MLMIFPADISPLSFSPVGEMQITLRSVKDLEMQITLVLSKTWRCRLLYVVDNLLIIRWLQAIARPPEYLSLPYGGGQVVAEEVMQSYVLQLLSLPYREARWGLMAIGGIIIKTSCAAGLSCFLSINHWLRKGSAPALANPNKSIAKIQEPLAQ